MLANNRGNLQLLANARNETAEWKSQHKTVTQESDLLRKRTLELETSEKQLNIWKQREDKIKHYLGVFTKVTR